MNNDEIKNNLQKRENWIHGFYILLFLLIYWVAELVVLAVVVYQFLSLILSGKTNERLAKFGADLSRYLYDILRYVTFNSTKRPYPFDEFPDSKSDRD